MPGTGPTQQSNKLKLETEADHTGENNEQQSSKSITKTEQSRYDSDQTKGGKWKENLAYSER